MTIKELQKTLKNHSRAEIIMKAAELGLEPDPVLALITEALKIVTDEKAVKNKKLEFELQDLLLTLFELLNIEEDEETAGAA